MTQSADPPGIALQQQVSVLELSVTDLAMLLIQADILTLWC